MTNLHLILVTFFFFPSQYIHGMLSSQTCAKLPLEDSNWYSVLREELYRPERNSARQLVATVQLASSRSSPWAPLLFNPPQAPVSRFLGVYHRSLSLLVLFLYIAVDVSTFFFLLFEVAEAFVSGFETVFGRNIMVSKVMVLRHLCQQLCKIMYSPIMPVILCRKYHWWAHSKFVCLSGYL